MHVKLDIEETFEKAQVIFKGTEGILLEGRVLKFKVVCITGGRDCLQHSTAPHNLKASSESAAAPQVGKWTFCAAQRGVRPGSISVTSAVACSGSVDRKLSRQYTQLAKAYPSVENGRQLCLKKAPDGIE